MEVCPVISLGILTELGERLQAAAQEVYREWLEAKPQGGSTDTVPPYTALLYSHRLTLLSSCSPGLRCGVYATAHAPPLGTTTFSLSLSLFLMPLVGFCGHL